MPPPGRASRGRPRRHPRPPRPSGSSYASSSRSADRSLVCWIRSGGRSWGRRAGRACSSISIHLRGSSWPGGESHRKGALLVLPQAIRVGRGCGSARAVGQPLACAPVSAVTSPPPQRTALFDRHAAAGAKLVEFAGWEMPVQYERRAPGAHGGARGVRDLRRLAHGPDRDLRAPARSRCCSGCSPTTSPKIPVGGAQYGVLCREDGGVLDDLFSYRLDADRYLTVTNAANHERDLEWFRAHARASSPARRGRRPHRRLRDARRAGPARARDRAGDRRRAAAGAHDRRRRSGSRAPRRSSAAPATPARTASSCCSRPATRRRCGTSSCAAAPRRPAWPRATRCAWRPAFPSTATSSRPSAGRSRRGSAGAARRTRASSAPTRCAPCAQRGPAERLVAFALDGPGIARQGNPIAGGGVVTSGTLSPCLEVGIGHGLRAGRARRGRHAPGDRRAWQACAAAVVRGASRSYRQRDRRAVHARKGRRWRRPATRRTCCTTPSTTGRASTRPSRGDARHHLVRPGRARRGRLLRAARGRHALTKDEPYAEVESVKAVSTCRAAVGRGRRGQRRARRATPARSTRTPTARAGWSGSACPIPPRATALLDAEAYARHASAG